MGFCPHQAVCDVGDHEDNEPSPSIGTDDLQDYYQQALLSDGLQRIDRWSYVVQDWNERESVLEVRLFFLLERRLVLTMLSQPGFTTYGLCQQQRQTSRLFAIAPTDITMAASTFASSRLMPATSSS